MQTKKDPTVCKKKNLHQVEATIGEEEIGR